jgi:phosphoglycerate dehydrogenase-like enzyme
LNWRRINTVKVTISTLNITEEFLKIVEEEFKKPLQAITVLRSNILEEIEDTIVFLPEHTPVDTSLLDKAPMLKLVQCGAGYDYVDLEAADKKGVYVSNAAGVNKFAVAEHTFALLLALAKKIVYLNQSMKNGEWKHIEDIALELNGKTIGIIGLGNIGKEVSKRALAFGMRVQTLRRKRLIPENSKIELVDFDTLLKESDFISVNVPLNKETYHMIGKRELNLMKKSALLINTSRGAVIDEDALYQTILDKGIAGAGIDVFSEEPLPPDEQIRRLDNVILTPHTAASTKEALKNRYRFFAKNALRIYNGKKPLNIVNCPYFSEN